MTSEEYLSLEIGSEIQLIPCDFWPDTKSGFIVYLGDNEIMYLTDKLNSWMLYTNLDSHSFRIHHKLIKT